MIRFPNPGSNPDTFLAVFKAINSSLGARTRFGLDDIGLVLTARGLLTSQGAIGEQALRRSTRPDRSRDPVYNNSKMFAELFRSLGWMTSLESRLEYRVSPWGKTIAEANDSKSLVRESLLGIAYPSDTIDVQTDQEIRPFYSILRAMDALDGRLSRDEMIVGPLSLVKDRDSTVFSAMVDRLMTIRRRGTISEELETLAGHLNVQLNTLKNYTRIPLAALRVAGWARAEDRHWIMSNEARVSVLRARNLIDLRLADYRALPSDARSACMRMGFENTLARCKAGRFLSTDEREELINELREIGIEDPQRIWFNPFQQLAWRELSSFFSDVGRESEFASEQPKPDGDSIVDRILRGREQPATPLARLESPVEYTIGSGGTSVDHFVLATRGELQRVLTETGGNVDRAVSVFVDLHSHDDRTVFYPLVQALLNLVGLQCELSRAGVNSFRMDALILHPDGTLPVEIKSPAEEQEISVKAIRQAVENKVVLLSRFSDTFPCKANDTSIVVGYNLPNARSEVHELIHDVRKVYGFNIGILSLERLARVAFMAVAMNYSVSFASLREASGVVTFVPATPEVT